MNSEQQYKQAKKIVKRKKGFYGHLAAFCGVGFFFFMISFFNKDPMAMMPMICWSVGLIIHYLNVFGFPGKEKILSPEWEAREIEKEIYNLGGEVEDDYLDLNEKQILQRRMKDTDWRENDLV